MSDTEKLTIDQRIEVARLATQIYMTEYPSGHVHSAAKLNRDKTAEMRRDEFEIVVGKQRKQDIRGDFHNIYQALMAAIDGSVDNQ